MSTLVVIVLSIVVLAVLIISFTGGFEKFLSVLRGYSGSELDNLNKLCQTQCNLDNKNSYCCEEKKLGKVNITCLDEKIKIECSMDCGGICTS